MGAGPGAGAGGERGNVAAVSTSQPESVVGRKASVSFPIPGGEQPGEVLVRIRGGSETYIAYCDQPVPLGADVVVVADRGARSLSVAPL